MRALLVAFAVLSMTALTAIAQTAPSGGAQQTAPLDVADQTFLMEAAAAGLAEIRLGKLAVEKAQSQAVRDFGQRMMTDHAKANEQLAAIAQQYQVALPKAPFAKSEQHYQSLLAQSGGAFDQPYMALMVKDHQEAIGRFEQQAKAGQNADVVAFAKTTLPVLFEHLEHAEQIDQQVKAASRDEAPLSPDQPTKIGNAEALPPDHHLRPAG